MSDTLIYADCGNSMMREIVIRMKPRHYEFGGAVVIGG